MAKKATYLVTGGCGFIGSHLTEALLATGYAVRVLDNLSTGKREYLAPGAEFLVGDITDPDTVRAAMDGVDGCFHLAAIPSVEKSYQDWAGTHLVNAWGTINVFEAAARIQRDRPVRVVYASSAAVYGANQSVPLSEDDDVVPLSAYAADKLACELHARIATRVHGIPAIGFRLFNVYGPRQDPASLYSGVISIFLDRMKRGELIEIHGDGEQKRDFVYFRDAVRFLMAGMSEESIKNDIFNVAPGVGTSIRQLAQIIAALYSIEPEIRWLPPRAGDIRMSTGDPTKARQLLGTECETEIREGLALTLDAL